MNRTSIEWCNRPQTGGVTGAFTWNPIRARRVRFSENRELGAGESFKTGTFCTRISPGCKNCYASVINKRFGTGAEYTLPNLADHEFYIDEKILAEPLKRKKPATIFVGDMFDLFHEAIPDEMIDGVVAVSALSGHTIQMLTKRAARMFTYFQRLGKSINPLEEWARRLGYTFLFGEGKISTLYWPIRNLWLGVSVEDQKRADERIPLLLQTPAAVRFVSCEPLLESLDLSRWLRMWGVSKMPKLNWIIVGGQSGPGARMFRREWAESLLTQCRVANVPFFMKQFGSYPILDFRYDQTLPGASRKLRDRKGGDPEEWPEGLRVREFPAPVALRKAAKE